MNADKLLGLVDRKMVTDLATEMVNTASPTGEEGEMARLLARMGFTTLRDLGMVSSRGLLTAQLCAVRDSIDAGIFPGPRMFVGGWTSITGSHLDLVNPRAMMRIGFQTADGPYELRKLARTNLRIGCDVIKTCTSGGGGTDKEEPDVRNMISARAI